MELIDNINRLFAIHGGVVDPAYSRPLIQNTDLPLADVNRPGF